MQRTRSASRKAPAPAPRSNPERTAATRQALLDAARELFVARGYGDTSTPDICTAAGITRGALYHHFVDKRDLFRQLLAREAETVRAEIEAAAPAARSAAEALVAGSEAYLDAMRVPGRTRLLLIEGPAVLGLAELEALDAANAAASLAEGLKACGVDTAGVRVAALAPLLSAAFDRAALQMEAGADARATRAAMLWLVRQVAATVPLEAPRRRR